MLPKYVTDTANNTGAVSFTLPGGASDSVGDTVYLVTANDWWTLANLLTPTGTAVGGGWTLEHSFDNGTSNFHFKLWKGAITNATGTVITSWSTTAPDEERYGAVYVFSGAATTGGKPTPTAVTSGTSCVAPSCTPGSANDCLILLYCFGPAGNTNFTMPGGAVTALTEYDFTTCTYRGGYESLSSAAATGTRTATSGNVPNPSIVSIAFTVSPPAAAVAAPYVPRRLGPNYRR